MYFVTHKLHNQTIRCLLSVQGHKTWTDYRNSLSAIGAVHLETALTDSHLFASCMSMCYLPPLFQTTTLTAEFALHNAANI